MSAQSNLASISLRSTFELLGDESSNGVWTLARARERATNRTVSIQRPAPGADEKRRERFAKEALAATKLAHEGLVAVVAVGRDSESGEVFCAVENAVGVRLSDRLTLGPLVESDLHALARRLAEALAHAHTRGFALGGISPSNVIVSDQGAAKIRGLGASRLGAPPTAPRDNDPYLDRDASGVEREPSFAGDLGSLGKLLFHAATGDPPHSVALGLLPAWLRAIVARCLGDSNDRFTRGSEVVAALLPLAERFRSVQADADSKAGSTLGSLSITLSPSRSPITGGATPPSSTPSNLRSTDGGTPGSPFPWQPLAAQYDVEAAPRSGGMGTVLKAKDRATGREVAIKRIRRDMLGSDAVAQRFRREAKSIARLNHAHILSLLHCARDEEGDYLVLEWAEGGSLRDRMSKLGKLPLDEVVAIARKIGGALVYAHAKGVIHRDIKPHNVLLTESGEPKLADFGLARGVGDLTAESSHAGAGTPLYIAPEQWKESRQADARSDLYSFAKMLYHLVTGDAPSSIDAERIPKVLRSPLLGALHDKPEARWPDVSRFLHELERSLAAKSGFNAKKIAVLLAVMIGAGAASGWVRGVIGNALKSGDRAESEPSEKRVSPGGETAAESRVENESPSTPPEVAAKPAPTEAPVVSNPTPPKPPTEVAPPADATPPVVEFTTMDGAPLPERLTTHDAALSFLVKANDEVGVVEATQGIVRADGVPEELPVSTMALRRGTSFAIDLPTYGEHRFELRARDEAGNATIRSFVVERRGRFPESITELFASIAPAPGSKLATPRFDLAFELAPAARGARVSIVSAEGVANEDETALQFDTAGRGSRSIEVAESASRLAFTLRFERDFFDPHEVVVEYSFLRGRAPHPDATRFAIVEAATSEDALPRRIRHVATGIDLLLVDDLVVAGATRAPFYVSPREVSIAEYRAFSGYARAAGGETLDRGLQSRVAPEASLASPLPDWPEIAIQESMPATFVSHTDAAAFCAEFEFTLLDEPTWRALAGKFQDDGLYSNFASSDANAALKFVESCGPDGWPALAPTAIFRPEKRGIRCLWGNVAEWLAADPSGATRIAGGSWIDRSELVGKEPIVARDPASRTAWIGFRVAFLPP